MTRVLLFAVILIFVLVAIFISYGAKDSYELLPANLNKPIANKPYESWQKFIAKQGNFIVEFPTLPQRLTESVPDVVTNGTRKYDMYVSQQADGSSFMISLITLTNNESAQGSSTQDRLIHEWVSGNPNNVLKEDKVVDFLSYKAHDFSIENDLTNIENRVFMVDKTLYLLTYLAQKEYFNKDDYNHFVNSFQLEPPSTSEPK